MKLIAAVSGGVDSCVMLHWLVHEKNLRPIVAHFDHGIRHQSTADARFVEGLAQTYDLIYELGQGRLGLKASEETARQPRHTFLREARDKYQAKAIATAHHHDDVVETAIINLLRGTGRRGLSSLKETPHIHRPLLDWTKSQIYDYALVHKLEWVEDETNQNDAYLRNRIRHHVVPMMRRRDSLSRFETLIEWFYSYNPEIEQVLEAVLEEQLEQTPDHIALPLQLLSVPHVGAEILHFVLSDQKVTEIDADEIDRLLDFASQAKPGSLFNQFPPLIIRKDAKWLLFGK